MSRGRLQRAAAVVCDADFGTSKHVLDQTEVNSRHSCRRRQWSGRRGSRTAQHRHEPAAFHSIMCAIAFSYSNEL
jgi:hypothetical protein